MYPIEYSTMIRNSKDPRYFRFEMVRLARKEWIKPAARMLRTTVKTVRKWLRRCIFVLEGRIHRPSQDSCAFYGRRIKINEITV